MSILEQESGEDHAAAVGVRSTNGIKHHTTLDPSSLIAVHGGEAEVSRRVYWDPEIYALECEAIFSKAWMFVAHETEIPNPGDYVTRTLGTDAVLVVRGGDNQVRIFLNACLHRGVRICSADSGSGAKTFECPYHGWCYSNTGKLMTLGFLTKVLYPDAAARKEKYKGLVEARAESVNGLIFGTWNWEGPTLLEYLGGWEWYLDPLTRRTPEGMEVVGESSRFLIESNWKLPVENFCGDSHHVATLHRGMYQLGYAKAATPAMKPGEATHSWHIVHPERGHTRVTWSVNPAANVSQYYNLPPSLIPLFESTLKPGQLDQLENTSLDIVVIFPYTVILKFGFPSEPDLPPMPYIMIRNYEPRGPDAAELRSWYLVDKEAPQWYKDVCVKNATREFSAAGIFEMDDALPWVTATKIAEGTIARRQSALFFQGGYLDPIADWEYPGVAYPSQFTELVQINFYQEWLRRLQSGCLNGDSTVHSGEGYSGQ